MRHLFMSFYFMESFFRNISNFIAISLFALIEKIYKNSALSVKKAQDAVIQTSNIRGDYFTSIALLIFIFNLNVIILNVVLSIFSKDLRAVYFDMIVIVFLVVVFFTLIEEWFLITRGGLKQKWINESDGISFRSKIGQGIVGFILLLTSIGMMFGSFCFIDQCFK